MKRELASAIEEIYAKYPKGMCTQHPDMHCVRHPTLPRIHFELDDLKATTWARLKVDLF